MTTTTRSPFEGTLVDTSTYTSVEGAMQAAGLDYGVEKFKVYTEPIIMPDGVSTVQMEQDAGIVGFIDGELVPFRCVGSGYTVIPNDEAFAPLTYLWEEGFIDRIEQAGRTRNGQRAFMLARLTSQSRLSDPHHHMVLIATTHDGTGSLTARGWTQRLFCKNQIPSLFNTRKAAMIRIAHSPNVREVAARMSEAILTSIIPDMDHYDTVMEGLMQQEAGQEMEYRFLNNTFSYRPDVVQVLATMGDDFSFEKDLTRGQKVSMNNTITRRNSLRNLISGEGNRGLHGTKAGLLQAAIEWSDYHAGGNRAVRMLDGNDVDFKRRAYNTVLSLSN